MNDILRENVRMQVTALFGGHQMAHQLGIFRDQKTQTHTRRDRFGKRSQQNAVFHMACADIGQ